MSLVSSLRLLFYFTNLQDPLKKLEQASVLSIRDIVFNMLKDLNLSCQVGSGGGYEKECFATRVAAVLLLRVYGIQAKSIGQQMRQAGGLPPRGAPVGLLQLTFLLNCINYSILSSVKVMDSQQGSHNGVFYMIAHFKSCLLESSTMKFSGITI